MQNLLKRAYHRCIQRNKYFQTNLNIWPSRIVEYYITELDIAFQMIRGLPFISTPINLWLLQLTRTSNIMKIAYLMIYDNLTLSMTSNTTVALPRAVAKVSSSGRALPREKLPMITANNAVTMSPAESSQAMIRVEPYLEGTRGGRGHYGSLDKVCSNEIHLPICQSISAEDDKIQGSNNQTGEKSLLHSLIPSTLQLLTIPASVIKSFPTNNLINF